jgi:hypothetical protein
MTYHTKLSEELKRVQGVTEKIKVLEQAFNLQALKFEELAKKVEALVEAKDQSIADYYALKTVLDERITALETRPKGKEKPAVMTAKAMAAAIGCSKDNEKIGALKFFARQFCAQNNLEIKRGENGEDHRAYEWFPLAAAEYAMAQVGGKK